MVKAPAIEVALTKVIEGRVSGYYDVFCSTIGPILDGEEGCGGWWVGPQIENPQHQILLENWRSVDVSSPSPFCMRSIPNLSSKSLLPQSSQVHGELNSIVVGAP